MSPKNGGRHCPDLIKYDDFYFCKNYKERPDECINHNFPARYCPIGMEKLGITNIVDVWKRLREGHKIIQTNLPFYI